MLRTLIIVPTEALQIQWKEELHKHGIDFNIEVQIINTVIKHTWVSDILIIDEIHRAAADTFKNVFTKVKYSIILGLTATLERLDDKHKIIEKYCPIIDSITLQEALANGWVSNYTEYKVMLDVADIDIYKKLNKEFTSHFEFFNFDYSLASSMVGKKGFINRYNYAKSICKDPKQISSVLSQITHHAVQFMATMQARKKFINKHPEKIRLTREIIKHRPNAKIITFSATTEIAESIKIGYVYTGKDSKKKSRTTIKDFSNLKSGVLNTIKKADEGLDVPGLSVAIILGMDSSPTRATQRKGRVIRKEGDKQAEIFNLVINNTVETKWFENSHKKDSNIITINEKGLMQVLNGETPDEYNKPVQKLTFRF